MTDREEEITEFEQETLAHTLAKPYFRDLSTNTKKELTKIWREYIQGWADYSSFIRTEYPLCWASSSDLQNISGINQDESMTEDVAEEIKTASDNWLKEGIKTAIKKLPNEGADLINQKPLDLEKINKEILKIDKDLIFCKAIVMNNLKEVIDEILPELYRVGGPMFKIGHESFNMSILKGSKKKKRKKKSKKKRKSKKKSRKKRKTKKR